MWPFSETNATETTATEGWDFLMHARVGMLRALNHGRSEPAAAPRRKRAKSYRVVRWTLSLGAERFGSPTLAEIRQKSPAFSVEPPVIRG
jgi:hypothetical protein